MEKKGYKVIGDSDNGLKAFKQIEQLNPDIVITDIKMPGMTGLEMVNAAKQENLNCKFIIISGFKDFQFCQEALRLGVCDYILKPIDFSTVISTVDKIRENYIKKSKDKNAAIKQYFTSVFSGVSEAIDQTDNDIKQILNSNYKYDICAILSDLNISDVEKYFSGFPFHFSMNFKNKYIFVVGDSDDESLKNRLIELDKCLYALMDNKSKMFCGFGSLCDIHGIYDSYTAAVSAADNDVFYGNGYKSCCFQENKNDNARYLKERINKIVNSLKSCDYATINDSLNEFFNYANLNRINRNQIIKFIEDLYIMIENIYNDNCINLQKEIEKLNQLVSISHLKVTVAGTLNNLIASIKMLYSLNKEPVEKIKSYVNTHYMTDITLNKVSQKFFFNPSYLSRLFKEKTNMTFSDFVNKVRVDKAKSMLLSSDLNIEKISLNTGFSSYRYFVKVFEKYTGSTPQEYRKSSLDISDDDYYLDRAII